MKENGKNKDTGNGPGCAHPAHSDDVLDILRHSLGESGGTEQLLGAPKELAVSSTGAQSNERQGTLPDSLRENAAPEGRGSVASAVASVLIVALLAAGYFERDHLEKWFGSKKAAPAASAAGAARSDIAYWTCTMHPSVHSKTPGKCPI